jgi:hypothetical protein
VEWCVGIRYRIRSIEHRDVHHRERSPVPCRALNNAIPFNHDRGGFSARNGWICESDERQADSYGSEPEPSQSSTRRDHMSNAIFFGWNRSMPGRERLSAQHFDEFVAYLTAETSWLQQASRRTFS